VIVWNTESLQVVKSLSGFHEWAIPIVKFSHDGTRLVTGGADIDHRIAVYDWQNNTIISTCLGGRNKVMAMDFTPDGTGILQVGIDHIFFHQLNGRNLATRCAILGKKGRKQVCWMWGMWIRIE
jgi:WD40 repeat protein